MFELQATLIVVWCLAYVLDQPIIDQLGGIDVTKVLKISKNFSSQCHLAIITKNDKKHKCRSKNIFRDYENCSSFNVFWQFGFLWIYYLIKYHIIDCSWLQIATQRHLLAGSGTFSTCYKDHFLTIVWSQTLLNNPNNKQNTCIIHTHTIYRCKGNPNDSDTMRFSDTFSVDQKCR